MEQKTRCDSIGKSMFIDEEKFRNSIAFLRMFNPRSFILRSEATSINQILSYKY